MKKTIKDYKEDLRLTRHELRTVEFENSELKNELNHYRRFTRDKFEWFVELNGKNNVPQMPRNIDF